MFTVTSPERETQDTNAVPRTDGTSGAVVVTVDWTNITHQSSMEDLIQWVKNSPQGQKFHVLIPSSRSHTHVRMLHHTLQTLGCRVTRKTLHSPTPLLV